MNFKERAAIVEKARTMDIVAVAQALEMDLKKVGSIYQWTEHDSMILDARKNYFYWNSRSIGGNAIDLVQAVKECDFVAATDFLAGVSGEVGEVKEEVPDKKDFQYLLKEHKAFNAAEEYLTKERGLSKETVQFFKDEGLIAQAKYKNFETGKTEPAIVFKSWSNDKVASVALQGVWKKPEYGKREHLKRVMGNGLAGFRLEIGEIPSHPTNEQPLKVVAFEAPIDMMSYYELYKDQLQDTVLVAMNGLKKGAISTAIADSINPEMPEDKKPVILDFLDSNETFSDEAIQLTLAVDNDAAGEDFIESFGTAYIPTKPHLPGKGKGQTKGDWNDSLKLNKQVRRVYKAKEVKGPNLRQREEFLKAVQPTKERSFSIR